MAEPTTTFKFVNEDSVAPVASSTGKKKKSPDSVSWTVTEAIFHEKSIFWYIYLILGTLIFAGLTYWLTRGDKITTGIIIFVGLTMAYFAGKRPEKLEYKLDSTEITIGNKSYFMNSFRSFFSIQEANGSSVVLIPIKRFAPARTLYCERKDEEKVLNAISSYIPMDKNREDALDRLMRRIKF